MVSNNGYPYFSNIVVTQAQAATQGITLSRGTQTVFFTAAW